MTHTRARFAWRRSSAALVALALLLCACFCPRTGAAASDGMIRVRLTRLGSRASLSFTATCAYYVDGNTARPIPAGAQATVDAVGGDLFLTVDGARTALGASCTLARGQGGARGIRFTSPAYSSLYCGDLMLSVSGGSIVPVLRIYIEDYLYGVVGYEMSNAWPLEALKAQAVAARNYALRCMSTRASRAYHVVDTSTDQVFRGYDGASSRVVQAVDETRNMALYAGSSIASCYYSASNGGQTEATRNVWGGNLSYSIVKDDPYDLGNPSATVKTAAIRRDAAGLDARLSQALREGAGGAEIVSILGIEPHTPKYASPSRLYTKLRFTIEAADGRQYAVDVDTYGALESWYGLSINSSSNETIYVEESADAFTIAFRRWGHGVGMSQRGAQTMARQGMSFRDILSFYYPGTQLRTLSLSDTTGSGLHDGGEADRPLGQVVCVSGADVYASASAGAETVGSVPAGALVDVYEAGAEWSRIGYGALRGWAQTALFALPGTASPSPSPSPSPAPTAVVGRQAVVTTAYEGGRLYLRSGPSTDTDPVTTVRHGDTVTAYETSGEWTAVETAAGRRGYLKSKYLVYVAEPTLLPVTPSPAPTATVSPSLEPWPTVSPTASASPSLEPWPTVSPTASASPSLEPWPTVSPTATIAPSCEPWPTVSSTPAATASPSPTPAPQATAAPTPQPTVPPLKPRPYGAFARVSLDDPDSRLNLRAEPSIRSAVLARLADGEYVEILDTDSGWARVETVSSGSGYVQTYYLRRLDGIVALPTATASASPAPTARPTATPAPTGAPLPEGTYARVALSSASSRLNLRAEPSTAAAIAGKLAHGEVVRALGVSGSWTHIETSAGLTGYVQSRYLAPYDATEATPAPTARPTATPAPTGAPLPEGTYARVTLSSASSRLNLRAEPSTAAAIAGRLAHGEVVRALGVSGSWTHIETSAGLTGYVQSRYLAPCDGWEETPAATARPTATPAPQEAMTEVEGEVYADIYVSASGGSLHVRQGPSTQTPSVTTVSHGSWVRVLAVGDEWARVRTRRGNEGYLKVKYLVPRGDAPEESAADAQGVVYCDLRALAAQDAVARAFPDAQARAVAEIPAGAQVFVKAYNDEWARVSNTAGTQSGYVLKAHLRLTA